MPMAHSLFWNTIPWQQLQETGSRALSGCRQMRRYFDKELDADDEELTRTQKVRRSTILTKYRAMIDALYVPDVAVAAGNRR